MPGATTTDCRQASEYFLGTTHRVWTGAEYITKLNPTLSTETLTAQSAVTVGTNKTITLTTPTVNRYWKGQRIRFGTAGAYKVVELAADYAVGVSALVAKEVLTEIAANDTAVEIPLLPYYSIRVTTPTVDGETKEIRNAGACDWSSKIMLKRMHNTSLSGSLLAEDPGYAHCKDAACSVTDRVFLRVYKADDTVWDGNFWVQSYSNPQETDTEVTVDFQLEGDGPPAEDTEYAIA